MPSFLREYREGLRCPKPPVPSRRPPNFQPGGSPFLAGSKKSRLWPCRRQEASLSRGVTRLRSGPCHATRRCSPPPRRFHKRAAHGLAAGKKPACPAGSPACVLAPAMLQGAALPLLAGFTKEPPLALPQARSQPVSRGHPPCLAEPPAGATRLHSGPYHATISPSTRRESEKGGSPYESI